MSLYSYFAEVSKRSDLPNPNRSLSISVSPAAIKEASEAVKSVISEGKEEAEKVTLSSHLSSKRRKMPSSIEPRCDLFT